MSTPSSKVMSRISINPILAAVMAAFMGVVLHGCSDEFNSGFVKTLCETSIQTEIDVVKGKKLKELSDKCQLKEEGAGEVEGVTKEEAKKVGDKCLGDGADAIEEESQKIYKDHLAKCIENGMAAANGTSSAAGGIWGAVTDYVNSNKDEWGNKTGDLLDKAVNKGLDTANELLEEDKAAAATEGGTSGPHPDNGGGSPGVQAATGVADGIATFTMQKVFTETGSGGLLMMFNAAVVLLAIGAAFASLRACRAARQDNDIAEEFHPTDTDM